MPYFTKNTSGKINARYENKPSDIETVELFDSEPEVQEFLNPAKSIKSDSLIQAENAYIDFCKLLGFEGKASTEDIKTKSEELYNSAQTIDDKFNAIKIPLTALGLINEISQQGGNWESIGE